MVYVVLVVTKEVTRAGSESGHEMNGDGVAALSVSADSRRVFPDHGFDIVHSLFLYYRERYD